VINANGILVHPDEIEKKILEVWPDLVISVVGLRDPSGIKDSIIVLCLQHGSSMDQEKLVLGLKNVDKNLIPQRIVEFETLPKTRTGKTNRKALAEAVTRHFSD
jgi:acyl-coenzyme A synthetase/AMP-(fatty) acid ligase